MRFYWIRNSYTAQIEAWTIVGLRFGYTTLGLALWPPKDRERLLWWCPHVRLEFLAHTGQCDQRRLFRFVFGRLRVAYRTRGDATPDLLAYGNAGLKVGKAA